MKAIELTDRLKGFFNYIKTRKITRWNVLALIALLTSVLASFPTLSRFYIYYTYKPPIDISIATFGTTIKWSDIFAENGSIGGIAVMNKDDHRDMSVQIDILVDKPVRLRPGFENYFDMSLSGNGFLYTMQTYLPANGGGGPAFPFEPNYEQIKIEITVYPKMRMSDFGLPRFFGDIDLQPFTKEFTIVP